MSAINGAVYNTSPIRRVRRTKAAIEGIKAGLHRIVAADQPMTVRQVFYQAVIAALVDKTEAEYQTTVARLLLEMRRAGELPYSWIADNSRWMRKPRTYAGLADFIETHQRAYRRDVWSDADTYVEMWIEKEALAGVVIDVTSEYDVPLMVSRGFASKSYLYQAAEQITDRFAHEGKRCAVYLLTDHDPSGFLIADSIRDRLSALVADLTPSDDDADPDSYLKTSSLAHYREAMHPRAVEMVLSGERWLTIERVAVTADQIRRWRLPSRPTKIDGNRHAKGWAAASESVELDAIHPSELRALVRGCIERHVDRDHLRRLRLIEAEERKQLHLFGQQLGGTP